MTLRTNSTATENNRWQSETTPFSPPTFTKRKRFQDSEAKLDELKNVHSSKQPRRISLSKHFKKILQEDSVAKTDEPENVRHSEKAQEPFPQPLSIQSSPKFPIPIFQPAGTKRKQLQDLKAEAEAGTETDELEDVRPSKQPREVPPSELPEGILSKASEAEAEAKTDKPEGVHPSQCPRELSPLSEKDLHALYEEVMNSTANNTRPENIRRSSSRRSTVAGSDITHETTRSKSSSSTNAHYRFKVLAPAQINVHADPPPKHIQNAIDAIVYAKSPEGRRKQLEPIVQEFQARCIERARASVGKNDFVKIFHDALDAMRFDNLCLRTNADWNDQLKPRKQYSPYNVGSLRFKGDRQQQLVDDASILPPAKPYISPQSSMARSDSPLTTGRQESAMLSFASSHVPEKEETIKTPRPDITMGLLLKGLASALSSQGLNEIDALLFLEDLERLMESHEPDGPEEPMLISVAAPRASDLVFPFGVDEGKAYLTGKPISEAENQAAGSGACAIKMQLRLDELVNRTAEPPKDQSPTNSDDLPAPSEQARKLPSPSEDQIPLFFPICTQGPVHVL